MGNQAPVKPRCIRRPRPSNLCLEALEDRLVASSSGIVATGADAGGGPNVVVYDAATRAVKFNFFAYDQNFTGGVRVAVGDVNGDGTPDIITAPGPGGGPDIHVYDGRNGQLLRQFFAYDQNFTGGCYIAAGDVNGDGHADIIVGADAGGGPNVTEFSGSDGSLLDSFFAYDQNFTGGVRVAVGAVSGPGAAVVITGAGPGGGPEVRYFTPIGNFLIGQFFATDASFTGGVYVAAADVNSDGRAEIIVGTGPGGGPEVSIWQAGLPMPPHSGLPPTPTQRLGVYFAYDAAFTGGVRVAAGNWDNLNRPAIVTVPGPGGGPDVQIVDPMTLGQVDQFFAYDPHFTGGLYVAAGD
jgi:hypothetical protein